MCICERQKERQIERERGREREGERGGVTERGREREGERGGVREREGGERLKTHLVRWMPIQSTSISNPLYWKCCTEK